MHSACALLVHAHVHSYHDCSLHVLDPYLVFLHVLFLPFSAYVLDFEWVRVALRHYYYCCGCICKLASSPGHSQLFNVAR